MNLAPDPAHPSASTQMFLLHMDPGINLNSNEILPLHLLDNSLDYGSKQYILPINSKQNNGQEHIEVLIDSSQESAKIMGLLLDKNCKNIQNVLSIPNIQSQSFSAMECSNTEVSSVQEISQDFIQSEINLKGDDNDIRNNGATFEPVHSQQRMPNYVHIPDRNVLPRALAVLPTVLQIQRNDIIATRRTLPMNARFGPVQGIKHAISHSETVELVLNATSNKKPLFLVKDNSNLITHIDVSDKDKSNWIGLLPLGDQNTANVWIYEENQELFAITADIIPPRKPLMLGYCKKYADSYGLIGPTKDINEESQPQKSWWCYECQRALPSIKLLENHRNYYHTEDNKPISKRRYRCRHCKRTFSRLFSLRRHRVQHCLVKIDKRNNVTTITEAETQINLNASITSEDNRIPSDESFQNYSNGLDFSTNLFDTDRIPSLDISGNSRSDTDFSPYIIGYKDENGLANDLDFPIKKVNYQNHCKEIQLKPNEHDLQCPVPCQHCNQIVAKGKTRQHRSKCPAFWIECECKKVFTNKNKYTHHVRTEHSNQVLVKIEKDYTLTTTDTNPQDTLPYKCEQCEQVFKRRGMLVNHLWRSHNTVSKVPLERRVRHYPCGTCPKIYRTAAKRDQHVQNHHPGAEKVRASLEGGTRVCEPAICSACPRQYATRAKLLQHQRAHHPYLVTPSKSKTLMKTKCSIAVSSIIGSE